jgi:hypothetical protein
MHMADSVRMCIDMGIDIGGETCVQNKTRRWVAQIGGCWSARLCLALPVDRAHHADTHAHSHGHRHRHASAAANQHCPAE